MASSAACGSLLQQNNQLGVPLNGTNGYGLPSPSTYSANPLANPYGNYTDNPQYARPVTSQTTPLPPEPLTEFQKFVASTTGLILPIYDADLFRRSPSTFAPLDMAPVPPDYVVGPGDELRLRVWGQVTLQADVRVDRSGQIYIPQVGEVQVAGLEFSALDSQIRKAVSRVYRNFDLTVNMGQIRAIQVYLSGAARRPGVYTVSSLSTLVDTLFVSGGPSIAGSMRAIELRRNGAVVTRFDLYDMLVRGDKTKDAKLLSGDVIYIPPVGPQVAMYGSVHNPAIYELLPNESLADALAEAGGLSSLAAQARISIDRVDDHRDRHAMEVAYDPSGLSLPLAAGDAIRVFSIVPKYDKTVTLRGNTANPGRFSWHEGMKVSELIPDKDSLLTRNYWWQRAQLGLPAPEFEPVPGFANRRQPTDNQPVSLSARPQLQAQQNLYGLTPGSGQNAAMDQANPNQYTTDQTNLDPNQLGQLAAGQNVGMLATQNQQQMNFAGSQFGQFGSGANLNAQQRAGSSALAIGETSAPASQTMGQAQRTTVQLPAPEIDWDYAVIERVNPENLKTELLPFDLGSLVLKHDGSQDLTLLPGDIVSIFSAADIRVPVAEQTKIVHLEGEFVHAGSYSVRAGETLRQLVQRAGGLTPNAYLFGSEFTRQSTRVIQQARIDEYVRNLSMMIQRSAISMSASGNPGSVSSVAAAQSSAQGLLESLKQIRATGRIVLPLQPRDSALDTIPNISLEDGDRFIVPHVPTTVSVVGAVYDENAFLFSTRGQTSLYLQQAGGPSRNADSKHSYVIRANGEIISREKSAGFWGSDQFAKLHIYPGDTIVVPEKMPKVSAIYGLMNWTQIMSQLAITAASLNAIQ
jgi:protein involved in polysaccharide export with SLBB domain